MNKKRSSSVTQTALLGYPTRLKPRWVCPYKRCLHHLPCRRYLHFQSGMQNFLEQQTFISVDLWHRYTSVKSNSSPGQSLLRSPTASSHHSASKRYLDHRITAFYFFSSSNESFLWFYSNSCSIQPMLEKGPAPLVLPQTYRRGAARSDHLHTSYRLGPRDLPNPMTTQTYSNSKVVP